MDQSKMITTQQGNILEVKCPKCKKVMKDVSHHMMGIDKKCLHCHVCWTYKHKFKVYPSLQ